jgi:rhodanese-related sulfurtransferase
MTTPIGRDEVRELLARGAQLVEVLPPEEFEWMHLRGARCLPLKALTPGAAATLERDRPVVTYCHDLQ